MAKNKLEINIPILARVEGEGALDLRIRSGEIEQLKLSIYEPPRLFEKFLEGREPNEVIDAVARICGICPVAYQMSASYALEQIFSVKPTPWVREMRRLFYCGEWLESHSIHIHMLAAPDFLGFSSVLDMAKFHPDIVKRGMKLHALGLELLSLLGKRSVNPVGACVGGFYKAPESSAVKSVLEHFEENLAMGEELVKWAATLPLPKASQSFTSVSLQHPDEYPMNEGVISSDQGLLIELSEFENYFHEFQVPYSNALHCLLNNKTYYVGPLARLNINHRLLPPQIKSLLKELKIKFPSKNMFNSIIARCVEIYYAMIEAIRIMRSYVYPSESKINYHIKSGIGFGCTEAPRGLLWHRYEVNDNGLVKNCRIVPPTSQNQARIEEDLHVSLKKFGLKKSEEEIRGHSEMVIRNYDPCISCSTHFLKVNLDRQ